MKIKYWLLMTYFLVMLLPVGVLYFLYLSINYFDQQQSFKEYLGVSSTFNELAPLLENPDFYEFQPQENYQSIEEVTDPSLTIVLYAADGLILYSTIDDTIVNQFTRQSRSFLYQNLNEIIQNYSSYSLKKTGVRRAGVDRLLRNDDRARTMDRRDRKSDKSIFRFIQYFFLYYCTSGSSGCLIAKSVCLFASCSST